MSDTVLVADHGDWVEITLNRPDKLNSFNEDLHLALRAAIEAARDGGKRAILLTGAGRGFCAGQDLSARDPDTMDDKIDLSETLRTLYNPLLHLIRGLDIPVICAVNGVAAGAGANVALACDIVLAAESARFIQSFAKVGLVPDAGGTWTLPHRIGEVRAKALALTAEPLSATQAADWGLIWKALPDEVLMDEARALAEKLAQGPTAALGLAKQAIQQAHSNTFEQQLDLEADYQKKCGDAGEYKEGVRAFLEKRAPNFKGA
ncbi:2-(1,2-epoxy-1,2-dihydrophenyl)acetyl-CoA isomerase PaaG [Rhodalgimonas zhirmunskyi]|uniref:2-(1,2-epoxy-1,2-dihydrophenyl)acetyl-CoA isomerase PaaG n=1 Tax=Rhodalgimonas zhirmunskyi TaxID=2964767 RepID=A0AAJ1U4Q1_9RHOB|nr:2-(1,2-epoxy-1,2-dihydrophenyl)acetyl-CoA isomerase PaaG [Rhodoalgimonas zhirmunskyi]MDQ2093140.1 2-(1,2-epoxy-1,2-dihydrophenyl)acetyl-CoA isomerase PaaG [Rhodoalgimonas zhirmunskyi]